MLKVQHQVLFILHGKQNQINHTKLQLQLFPACFMNFLKILGLS